MPPQTRRTSFPAVVIERDTDSEESSSDEDEVEDVVVESEEEEEVEEVKNGESVEEEPPALKKREKVPITISLKKVCKVSGTLFVSLYFPLFIPKPFLFVAFFFSFLRFLFLWNFWGYGSYGLMSIRCARERVMKRDSRGLRTLTAQ